MPRKSKKAVKSLQDLADLAGVSRATASRALNDSPMLSDRTKKKLQALARKHNYSINRKARDFRLRRSGVVSVIFMRDTASEQHLSDPFFLELLGSIADSLADNEYDLLLAHESADAIDSLREGRVFEQSDGVIFVGQGTRHDELNTLAEGDKPIVAWGSLLPDRKYRVAGGENRRGGYLVTKHLLDLGRRRIAFFGKIELPEISDRYAGYCEALLEHGLSADPDLQVDVPFEMEPAQTTIREFLEHESNLDAVVCASDVMALSAIATFRELGLRVPEDVAVTGYDDIALAAYSSPSLTTVRQNIRQAGKVLVDSVLGLINGQAVDDTTLESELVIRKSSGAG